MSSHLYTRFHATIKGGADGNALPLAPPDKSLPKSPGSTHPGRREDPSFFAAALGGVLMHAPQIAGVGELAASIAHEVNQPLSAVVANAHACIRWLSAEPPNLIRAQKAAERIVRESEDAAEVVRHVSALFKRSALDMAPVNLNNVVHEVLHLLAGEASKRRVRLERELDAELPDVLADRVQLEHLVRNLVVNAFDAMESVEDRPKALLVRSHRDGAAGIVVEICDSGIGMTDPERAFEPFFTTKPNGMGMGLSICRSIVEAHRGALWVESREGPGTTVCFRLPVPPKGQ